MSNDFFFFFYLYNFNEEGLDTKQQININEKLNLHPRFFACEAGFERGFHIFRRDEKRNHIYYRKG